MFACNKTNRFCKGHFEAAHRQLNSSSLEELGGVRLCRGQICSVSRKGSSPRFEKMYTILLENVSIVHVVCWEFIYKYESKQESGKELKCLTNEEIKKQTNN